MAGSLSSPHATVERRASLSRWTIPTHFETPGAAHGEIALREILAGFPGRFELDRRGHRRHARHGHRRPDSNLPDLNGLVVARRPKRDYKSVLTLPELSFFVQ